ncbi:PLDc_N domain-containing protein [Plantactinospora sp. S1510]|uniref:PLDc_N domain-containing protein n=1 Tax=Plantactinospora alkalitolerans TaxID=2789879 RepID=A0ABS0H7Y4_9ACTN|nr:PLD nuclease N-terminal domain-containing protein [Plantactinospora alkalitolerans]MBF9134429.1 PLDc_N domain-containing protein [Plantactinospora alkalitolerans]
MVRLYAILAIGQLILAVVALISCLSAENDEIRALPRFAWVLIILFFPLVGSIAWFVAGRPVPATPAAGNRPGGGVGGRDRQRPLAPDDDPEFLRSLDSERSKQDRELLERWERDLRRREDELRRGDSSDPPREEDKPEA